MYNIGSAFNTACVLLHFPPMLSYPAFSTPAFSVVPLRFRPKLRCLTEATTMRNKYWKSSPRSSVMTNRNLIYIASLKVRRKRWKEIHSLL